MKIIKLTAFTILLSIFSGDIFGQESREPEVLSGTWMGELDVIYDSAKFEELKKETYIYLFQICSGNVEVRFSKDGNKYYKMSGPFEIKSTNGSTLIYTQNSQKKWVQTNVWSIIKLSEDRAYFQLLRDVSNFRLKADNKKRYLGLMGKGALEKVSNECNVFEKKP